MTKYLNSQRFFECQLVAVINAAVYLGQPMVDPDSSEYERLVDLVRARHGSALCLYKAVEYLRLDSWREPYSRENLSGFLAMGNPVSVSIYCREQYGHHVVFVSEACDGKFRVYNLSRYTDDEQWISSEEFEALLVETQLSGSLGGPPATRGFFMTVYRLQDVVHTPTEDYSAFPLNSEGPP